MPDLHRRQFLQWTLGSAVGLLLARPGHWMLDHTFFLSTTGQLTAHCQLLCVF